MSKTFRFMFSAIATMILFNGFAAIETNAQGIPNKILTKMEENRNATTSLKADISMVNYDPNIGNDTKTGTLLYASVQNKGKEETLMRLDWIKPKKESISVVKKEFLLYDVKAGVAFRGNADSQKVQNGQGGGLIKLLTSSSKEELKSQFSFEYLGEETAGSVKVLHLKLTPNTKQDYKFADIWIDKDGMPIMAKTTSAANNTQTIGLSNLKPNVSLNISQFKILLPPNVKPQSV